MDAVAAEYLEADSALTGSPFRWGRWRTSWLQAGSVSNAGVLDAGMSWGRYRKGLRVKAEEHLGIRSVWRDAWLPTEEACRRRDITRCTGR